MVINQSDDFSESENRTKATIEISKNQPIYDKSHTTLHEKKTLQSAGKINDLGTLEKENSDPLLKSEGHLQNESIVEGVGLSEKELNALHVNQKLEIEQLHWNMDSIVISPAEEDGKGIALGELLALHGQQKQAIADTDGFDEIVIPALKDGDAGLTRMDLIELHKQQRLAIENAQNWDQIVIPDSGDGYPGLTWVEVATVQELQTHMALPLLIRRTEVQI